MRANSWLPTSIATAPSPRAFHTAVWTGAQMIVWGGYNGIIHLNTGRRYTPGTNIWEETSMTNAPSVRSNHTAVWTGTEMIVWGGQNFPSLLNSGGRYKPGSNSWLPTPTLNASSARYYHTAVWTGTQMIVWGGNSGNFLNTGGRYNPAGPGLGTWTPTSTGAGVPSVRQSHAAVRTGKEMIVWGGYNGNYLNTVGLYNPAGPGPGTWIPTNPAGAPSAREGHTAVWTGTQMIVWGGKNGNYLNTGGRYTPGGNWLPTSTLNAPSVRSDHTAVWTGTKMIVWGGYNGSYLNSGGRYSPPHKS